MRFDIMTLFPDVVKCVLESSIIGRAQQNGYITVQAHDIRDYTLNKHKKTDDTPYGGGKGMLMATQPICDCFEAVRKNYKDGEKTRVIYASPRGRVFNHEIAMELSRYDNIVILCGHYEGVDQRVIDEIVDEELSVGDYVLTGGEIPACIMVDATARLVPGVLSDKECYEKESIASGLLEYPQYTRPAVFHGKEVPQVLLSGHHENIDTWRLEKSLELTKERRPDLYERYVREHEDELMKLNKKKNLNNKRM
ncbi:MAG: tRNA (guanosine(37)-N1)-methyltransferase TrmD [Clostridia bacterium]|nr:tRNA (guanosine(37)-N1)-methyltransferase TrmD [Clostridia bacterium]